MVTDLGGLQMYPKGQYSVPEISSTRSYIMVAVSCITRIKGVSSSI